MLKVGDLAPDFEVNNEAGELVSLSGLLADGPLVIYFYPGDFTPVCTAQACSIRDMYDDILATDIQVVGVSPQGEGSHQRFKQSYQLPFPLLVDPGRKLIRSFGVTGPLGFGVRRATFLIDQDKNISRRVVSDFLVGSHTSFIRQILDQSGQDRA
jgi:thioredoxin-dependent peroxiredoxin